MPYWLPVLRLAWSSQRRPGIVAPSAPSTEMSSTRVVDTGPPARVTRQTPSEVAASVKVQGTVAVTVQVATTPAEPVMGALVPSGRVTV